MSLPEHFEHPLSITPAHIYLLGHVSNIVYDYMRAAVLGDQLFGRTWVGSSSQLKFERQTEIVRSTDAAVLVKARTLWCPVSRLTGKPTPVGAAVRATFSTNPGSTKQPAWTCYFGVGQKKFEASFGSPEPLYFATAG